MLIIFNVKNIENNSIKNVNIGKFIFLISSFNQYPNLELL